MTIKSSLCFYKKNLFILVLFLIVSLSKLFSQENVNFTQLEPKRNNKSLNISQTLQDDLGYIWMSHSTGIVKYYGNSYSYIDLKQIFKNLKTNDRISQLTKDNKGNIWIVTQNGLAAISDTHGQFRSVNTQINFPVRLIHSGEKNTWIATQQGGIYTYNSQKSELDSITTIPNIKPNSYEIMSIAASRTNELFISTDVGEIYQYSFIKKELSLLKGPFSNYPGHIVLSMDLNNNLWIGTETIGLFAYNYEKKQFIQDSLINGNLYNIKHEMFLSLFCDSNGFIWGGTDGGGLYRINPNNGSIHVFTHLKNNKFSLSSNTIININEDDHKNIWVITNYGVVNVLSGASSNIGYHEGSDDNTPTRVLSIYKSVNGNLWIGTDGAGITKVVKEEDGTFTNTQYFSANKLNKGIYVQTITGDKNGNIWFGTYKNGLWYYNLKNESFKKIPIINSKNQKAHDIRTVFTDSKERIWVGSNISLNIYSIDQKLLASFDNNTQGLKGVILESIDEDGNDNIWLGYYKGGLFKFEEDSLNLKNSTFINYDYYDTKIKNKDIKGIYSIVSDGSDALWLINSHSKLLKFNTINKTYNSFDSLENFKNLSVRSVLVEDKENLWLSTTNGILHVNIKDALLKNYNKVDGLQENSFKSRSSFKDKDGILYFGGLLGLNYFNPKNITKKTTTARLHINAIEILNQPADSLIPEQITSGINLVKNLDLNYSQSSFSFRFSAIDNILYSNYFYAYRLKGFNNDWISANQEYLATYTNIPPGNYTFEVKAGSEKGVWDIPSKEIKIHISKPIWNSYIAYVVYFILLLALALGLKKWYILRNNLLSEKINNKRDKELHTLKMNFFAKMSHEIQTPLTLILSPIDDMLIKAKNNGNLLLEQRLQIISNNAKRLSRIVFELTTIRNKEIDKIRLLVTKNNLFEELHQIALSFNEQARLKHIDFMINCPKNLSEAWYDKDKFEHIIYNLISNAFKFTPKEGNIHLIALPVNNKNSIKISISDSGPGIPKEELDDIFTLFYQSKIGKQNKGTGIGLALTKELIDLHRGKVEVTSSPSEGTCFTVTLPITEDAYLEEERVMVDSKTKATESLEAIEDENNTDSKDKLDKTILIVEDNFELQHFLKGLLSPIYNIILADNGEEGYYYAKSNLPDLILSDIMMPKLDGIEMSEMLQKNHLTNHIPIVFLTAKNSTNSKISALKSGAIEYINKPFDTNELLLKVHNIIISKEHIISKYRKETISRPKILLSKSQDEIFLENLVQQINLKLDNANFKIEELADSLNMSYSSLYRKCQSLTGNSLVDFVRLIRLKKAAILITKYGYNISETSFRTGFNDPKYFSKCFKKQFNKTPGVFKKEALKTDVNEYLKKYSIDDMDFEMD